MKQKTLLTALFAVLLLAGTVVRFVDLTDQPLDFNPSRQLFSAIIARAIYYESLPGVDQETLDMVRAHRAELEKLEPPILEMLVVAGYRLTGGENLWIARVISILAWLGGSVVVYFLAKRVAGSIGALVGMGYFLFLPLAIYASRSFQVDSTMVVLFGAGLLALLKWTEQRSWTWAAVAGATAGLAVLLKGYGAILMGPPMAAVVWSTYRAESGEKLTDSALRLMKDRQAWLILLLTLLPAMLYYPGLAGETRSLYTRSIFNRLDEVLAPSFYIRWLILLDRLLGLPVLLAAFAGAWLAPSKTRRMLLGFWLGYGLYGLTFPKLIITHDYYQLPLVLIAAVSLAPVAELVGDALFKRGRLAQLAFAGLLLLSAAYPAWIARSVLVADDYRQANVYWEEVGAAIPTDGRSVGYTQDYGFRLMYYGQRVIGVLPEQISAEKFIADYAGADYFVVTARNQMSADLAGYLEANYPVIASGGGYTVYDLKP